MEGMGEHTGEGQSDNGVMANPSETVRTLSEEVLGWYNLLVVYSLVAYSLILWNSSWLADSRPGNGLESITS